jgi:RNA polymerase sigma-70 factor (ECF subfamily)
MLLAAAMDPETIRVAEDDIDRLRRGDPGALSSLLLRHQHRVYRFLLRMVQDPSTAEDLFQQTWLRVMEKISSFSARYRFESWLFSVAHNLAIDHLRRKRGVSLDAEDESGTAPVARMAAQGPDPLEQLLASERRALVAAAVAQLPTIHREVVTLRFEEGMKLEEIAEVAGVPLATVKSRLHRALEGLRRRMESQ